MRGIEYLDVAVERGELLWYVAHPVHPTEEEVAAWARRLKNPIVDLTRGLASDLDPTRLVILDNIANAKAWLGWLIRRSPSLTFIAPWIAAIDGGGDDDLIPEQRARGLRDCCRTIRACSGMVHTGGRVSSGMLEEAGHAWEVIDLTNLGRTPPVDNREART